MRYFICCMCLGTLFAKAIARTAQAAETNEMPPRFITNGAANAPARLPAKPSVEFGTIATNTPAFQEYGYNLMLAEINKTRERWQLDIPERLTTNNVYFTLRATAGGVEGSVATRDHRFSWMFAYNRMIRFVDGRYFTQTFRYHDEESARLAKIPSKITAKKAEAMARNYLHQLGLTEKQLELIEPPVVNQYKFEETDGKVYPLPMFNVAWHNKGFEEEFPNVTFDISGIIKNVAEYYNTDLKTTRAPRPTNYLDMLGVKPPTNDHQRRGFELWPLR